MNDDSVSTSRTPIVALLAANTISQIGNVVALVAIPWFVYETTGSAAKTGLAGFFTVLPVVLAGFFGGAIVDRLGHRRSSILADLLSGLSVAAIPLLYFTLDLSFWHLVTLVFLGALLDLPGSTARQSLVPDLAELAKMRPERVNAAFQTIQQTSFLIGPPLAGLLIAILGPTHVLWIDAASFAVSAGLVAVAIPQKFRVTNDAREPFGGYLTEVLEGWRFIARERTIFALTAANAVANLLGAPLFAVILPIYASQTFGNAIDLGLMLGGAATGSLVGAILYGLIGYQFSRRWLYAGGWLIGTIPFWVLAGIPPLIITLSALVLLGLADGPINPLMHTLSQERTPRQLRARVFGARIALANVAAPLGMLVAGYLIEAIGLTPTLILMAAVHSLAAVLVVFLRPFRQLDPPAQTTKLMEGRDRPSGQLILPHLRILTVGCVVLLLGLLLGTVVGTGWMAFAAVLAIFTGWIVVGTGLRPFGSMGMGAVIAIGLYGLIGVAVSATPTISQHGPPVEEIVPTASTLPVAILIALMWPLFVIQFGMRTGRRN